jgi:indolepyruvate ferredoxin oxidoreductase, beta subunit
MSARPISILIAALGGEGGGVLTDWIIAAAESCDLPAQSTSIPGVAQRTGATTYYIEIYPTPWRELGGKRPVLALAPGIGDVDMVVASEFLEAGRAVAGGFVTRDRTLLIASTHRSHAIAEKMAMGDGRFDTARLMGAVEKNVRSHLLFDMNAVGGSARAMINSVMLGAVAASGGLPIPAAAFEAAIRMGKSSDANLRGFRAGVEAAERGVAARSSPPPCGEGSGVGVGRSGTSVPHPPAPPPRLSPSRNRIYAGFGHSTKRSKSATADFDGGEGEEVGAPQVIAARGREGQAGDPHGTPAVPGDLENEAARFGDAAEVVTEGVRRLVAYQDTSYARLYLDRLARVAQADARAGARARLTREAARHLALRMSYEDVIRVAEAKIAPERMARIASRMSARPGEPVTIVEFLKPGIAEMCSVLPPFIARPIIAMADRRGWSDKLHWGMEINTTSVFGYLRFLALARLRPLRPRSYRYSQEQAAIDAWLALIIEAAAKSDALAIEVAECARLIKGYGDTLKRGAANYAAIERHVIQPTLAGAIPLSRGIDAVASARVAALADPEGEALATCLAEIVQIRDVGTASPLPCGER